MLRRLLRRLLQPPSPTPAAAPPRRPPPVPAPEPEEEPQLEVEGPELRRWVDEGRPVLLLDVRERAEVEAGHALGALLVPMNEVPERLALLPRDRVVVVYCAAGARSFGVAHYLREQGFPEAWSLAGGLGAWTEVGGAYTQPGRGGRALLSRVALPAPLLRERGVPCPDAGLTGIIQAVEGEGAQRRYAVLAILEDGQGQRLEGVSEQALGPAPGSRSP